MSSDSMPLVDLPALEDEDLKPNFTQFPNILLDVVLPLLRPGEQAVLWYLVRRTYGFHQGTAEVSLSEIMHGVRGEDGQRLDHGTGLSKNTALDSVRSLINRKIIEVVGSGLRGVRSYRINLRASEWDIGESENSTGSKIVPVVTGAKIAPVGTGAKIAPVVTGAKIAPDLVQKSRQSNPAKPSAVRDARHGKKEKETRTQPEGVTPESLFPVDAPAPREPSAHARERASPETHRLVKRHAEIFERRTGQPYPIHWAKECQILRRLLGTFTVEQVEAFQDAFFAQGDDSWAHQAGMTVGVFSTQVPKLAMAAAEGPNGSSSAIPQPEEMDFEEFCRWKRGRGPDEMTDNVRGALRREWETFRS